MHFRTPDWHNSEKQEPKTQNKSREREAPTAFHFPFRARLHPVSLNFCRRLVMLKKGRSTVQKIRVSNASILLNTCWIIADS
jgi:hypothetical protein